MNNYCWCEMCGFVKKLDCRGRLVFAVSDDVPCPDCKEVGEPSLLCVGARLPDHVIPDDPMGVYEPETTAAKVVLPTTPPATEEVDGVSEETVQQSIEVIRTTGRACCSILQRRLRIGYTRSARVMDILEERGIVGPHKGAESRDILINLESPKQP